MWIILDDTLALYIEKSMMNSSFLVYSLISSPDFLTLAAPNTVAFKKQPLNLPYINRQEMNIIYTNSIASLGDFS